MFTVMKDYNSQYNITLVLIFKAVDSTNHPNSTPRFGLLLDPFSARIAWGMFGVHQLSSHMHAVGAKP